MAVIRQALLSVSDKTGIVDFARGLAGLGVKLISTGGTARLLQDSGVRVTEVADYTGFPEMLDGRVKTLHPKVHAGILARRDLPAHMAELDKAGIGTIDLVAINLYPFGTTVARAGCTLPEAIENIDIGGPALVRSAAKNHDHVAVLTDPADYQPVLKELNAAGGALGAETRFRLAQRAFSHTAHYDGAISNYLTSVNAAGGRARFPGRLTLQFERAQDLRYGENPHQDGALYGVVGETPAGLAGMKSLHGPDLGYNNVLDFSAALGLLMEFDDPAAVVIKHTNPCGVALGSTAREAMEKAKACDPVSIYGGIVGVNRELDLAVVRSLAGIFVEILFAPAFTPDALEELRTTKKKCRVVEVPTDRASLPARLVEYRSVLGGLLAQSADLADLDPAALKTVTKRAPTTAEITALRFAWRVGKHAKSNAIVLASAGQVVGVGAGQMNRLDSARIAVMRAREFGLATQGAVCASDAFFPFRDGLDAVAAAGITAVIQPGGSLRDEEVIAAADEHGIAMVFTGIRHFRH